MIVCENPVFDSLSAFEQVMRIRLSFVAKNSLADFDMDLFMCSRKTEIKMSHCESLYEKIYDIMEGVKVSMLVMFGQKDVTVSRDVLARIKNQVRGCEFKEFKNCKHWIHLDSQWEYFECVDGFIKKNLA